MNIRTAPRPEAPRSPALSLRSFSAAVILCLLALGLPPRLEGAVTNGVPVVWGNYSNLLNRVPTGLSNVQAVACGYSHNLALHNDGTVTAWGENWSGETDVPPGLSAVRAISAGRYFSVALRSNGTVVAWGANDGYQTNVPVGLSGVKAIAAGEYHCLALTSNGVVVGWGSGSGASVPLGLPTIIAISAGTTHSMALTSGYRVICWGQDTYGKATVPAWLSTYQVVGIAAGGNHSLALARGGWITGWGDTSHGQTPYNQYLSGVAAIAAGQNHSLVLFSNFTAYAFGDNTASQCILPATLNSNGVAISASGDMSMALTVNPPRITTQPLTNQSVVAGTNVGFTVVASGGAPLFYQWRKNGSAIGGATNASYSIASAQTGDSGAYSVLVSNLTGTTLSSNAALVVNLPPLITVNPVGFPALEGSGPFDLVVGAAGTAPLGYLWRKNGTPLIPLETSPTYRIWIVQADSGGDYTCVVTNAYGAATSDVARVTGIVRP